MGDTVEVEVPRIPERDELLKSLAERGIEASPIEADDHLGIEIPCGDDTNSACDEIVRQLESWIADAGLALVPVKADGHVYLRPPAP
jgi:hypothetical protein